MIAQGKIEGILNDNDLWKWVLGIVTALVVLGVGAMTTDNRARLERLDSMIDRQSVAQAQQAERTRALEANYADILRRLDRIDTKLDNALRP